jgi:hypothetical protein
MLSALTAAGCAHQYKAPDRPPAELAVLTTNSDELAVVSVDGRRTSLLRGTGCKEVAMLPGAHEVVVQHKRNGHIAEGTLSIDAKAGDRYVLKSESKGYHVGFWIEKVSRPTDTFI